MRRKTTRRIGAGRIALLAALIWTAVQAGGLFEGSQALAQKAGGTKSDSKVQVAAAADKAGPDGQQLVTVTITIEKGWHIYANKLPDDFAGIATAITIKAQSKPEEVKIDYPEGAKAKDGDYRVYEGKVTIKAHITRAKNDNSPLGLSVNLQACSDTTCLPPATVEVVAP